MIEDRRFASPLVILLAFLLGCGGAESLPNDAASGSTDATTGGSGGSGGGSGGSGGGSGGSGPAVVDLAAGSTAMGTCARLAGGEVRCWGTNEVGQLGLGAADAELHATPEPIPGLAGVVDLALGRVHACALGADGSVLCWGDNAKGELGDGTTDPHAAPAPVPGLAGVVQVAVGHEHTCALLAGGTVSCWGSNGVGELGIGPSDPNAHPMPEPVPGLNSVLALSLGMTNTCALRDGGTVSCWGSNVDGQIGNGTEDLASHGAPEVVQGLGNVAEIAVGHSHACARKSSGTVACWGSNTHGQIGVDAVAFPTQPAAVDVPGLTGVETIAVGFFHSCGRLTGGAVTCWGSVGAAVVSTPTAVDGVTDAALLVLGAAHSCVLDADGKAACWGVNAFGQLGDGTTDTQTSPTPVAW